MSWLTCREMIGRLEDHAEVSYSGVFWETGGQLLKDLWWHLASFCSWAFSDIRILSSGSVFLHNLLQVYRKATELGFHSRFSFWDTQLHARILYELICISSCYEQ